MKHSAALVVFGATGDLFAKKVVPSLLRLQRERRLPLGFAIIGFGRKELGDEGFKSLVRDILIKRGERVGSKEIKQFVELFTYLQGEFHSAEAFKKLGTKVGVFKTKVFYLAIPPELFPSVLKNVARYTLRRTKPVAGSSTRLMIEKPFGKDGKSSAALDTLLHKYFTEREIYRIDHYLAKRVLRTLPVLKQKHAALDAALKQTKRIDVALLESIGVEHRGAFYDSVGALRDVGQNHLLIKIALALMRVPASLTAAGLRKAREAVLAHFPLMSPKDVTAQSTRAQYEGYRSIPGVHPKSNVETHFTLTSTFKTGPYRGTEFSLEAGKCAGPARKEALFTLRDGAEVRVELEPKMRVVYRKGKKQKVYASFAKERGSTQYTEEYSELIANALKGDQSLFLSSKEVSAMWRFIDPILRVWKSGHPRLLTYVPDSKYTEQR